jgi:hypothetical protein
MSSRAYHGLAQGSAARMARSIRVCRREPDQVAGDYTIFCMPIQRRTGASDRPFRRAPTERPRVLQPRLARLARARQALTPFLGCKPCLKVQTRAALEQKPCSKSSHGKPRRTRSFGRSVQQRTEMRTPREPD